ncbi:MAG TPA: putative 2OG-Fe(II) oxygenase [Allosphingosinicella sp.]|jgi:tetratricopeptide (TPR) repeat protein
MLWRVADHETVADPFVIRTLLTRAVEARPDNPALHLRLADLELDRYDFAAAARALETALRLDPAAPGARLALARCCNALGRPRDALDLLKAAEDAPSGYQRGLAMQALGLSKEAESEYRAVLAVEPGHREACRKLCTLVREDGRSAEMLEICESLAGRGVRHAQLLYDWGIALALNGREEEARAILFDPKRVVARTLPVPEGFADLADFNAALAQEIIGNPHRLSQLPADEANRGSSRVHSLVAGERPELVQALLGAVRKLAAAYPVAAGTRFDPWAEARPIAAHLRSWGLIQRGGDYEEWHLHRGGWLSGVYYARVPASVSARGEGRGCIEFGPPGAVIRAMPDFLPVERFEPSEGMLLMAPSHYRHRTIPTGADEYRVSIAFDVVADESPSLVPKFRGPGPGPSLAAGVARVV